MEEAMKKMYGHIILSVLIIISLSLVGCSSNSSGPEEEEGASWELVGNWAGIHFEFVDQIDTTLKANLSSYGVSYSMAVNVDSTYSSQTKFLSQSMDETGKIFIDGENITFAPFDGVSHSGVYTYTEETADIRIDDESFDFDQDGNSSPAYLYIQLARIVQ